MLKLDSTTIPGDVVDDSPATGDRVVAAGSTTTLSATHSIADQYAGLLERLTPGQRRGLVAKLSIGYYDGWRPTRVQLAKYIAEVLGINVLQ